MVLKDACLKHHWLTSKTTRLLSGSSSLLLRMSRVRTASQTFMAWTWQQTSSGHWLRNGRSVLWSWFSVECLNYEEQECTWHLLVSRSFFQAVIWIWGRTLSLSSPLASPAKNIFPWYSLHCNISMFILHTVLCTFLEVLTKWICQTIKSFFSWWLFPLFWWSQCFIQGWYCKEKVDAGHSKGSKVELCPILLRVWDFSMKEEEYWKEWLKKSVWYQAWSVFLICHFSVCFIDPDWGSCWCENHWWLPVEVVLHWFHKKASQPNQEDSLCQAFTSESHSQEDGGHHYSWCEHRWPQGCS